MRAQVADAEPHHYGGGRGGATERRAGRAVPPRHARRPQMRRADDRRRVPGPNGGGRAADGRWMSRSALRRPRAFAAGGDERASRGRRRRSHLRRRVSTRGTRASVTTRVTAVRPRFFGKIRDETTRTATQSTHQTAPCLPQTHARLAERIAAWTDNTFESIDARSANTRAFAGDVPSAARADDGDTIDVRVACDDVDERPTKPSPRPSSREPSGTVHPERAVPKERPAPRVQRRRRETRHERRRGRPPFLVRVVGRREERRVLEPETEKTKADHADDGHGHAIPGRRGDQRRVARDRLRARRRLGRRRRLPGVHRAEQGLAAVPEAGRAGRRETGRSSGRSEKPNVAQTKSGETPFAPTDVNRIVATFRTTPERATRGSKRPPCVFFS